ncbi:MAG: hypothetical protein AAF125_03295 [Chloroflexota bacterium]
MASSELTMKEMTRRAERAFFMFHPYLERRIRRLQAKLEDAGVSLSGASKRAGVLTLRDSVEYQLLRDRGFPLPDVDGDVRLPEIAAFVSHEFYFRVATALDDDDSYVLYVVRRRDGFPYERVDLMRVSSDHVDYIEQAAVHFEEMLDLHETLLVYRSALLWAQFHGGVILGWYAVNKVLLTHILAGVSGASSPSPVEIPSMATQTGGVVDDALATENIDEVSDSTAVPATETVAVLQVDSVDEDDTGWDTGADESSLGMNDGVKDVSESVGDVKSDSKIVHLQEWILFDKVRTGDVDESQSEDLETGS